MVNGFDREHSEQSGNLRARVVQSYLEDSIKHGLNFADKHAVVCSWDQSEKSKSA